MQDIVLRSLQAEEFPAWFDHVSTVFKQASRHYFMRHWYNDPWRRQEGIFVAAKGQGEICSTVRVFHRRVFSAFGSLPMGGIGEVSTKPEYRRQGLSGRLLQLAVDYMQKEDLPISYLFTGVNKHYARQGWRTLPVALYHTEVPPAKDLRRRSACGEVRPIDWGVDFEALQRVYDAYNGQRVGPPIPYGMIDRSSPLYWWHWVQSESDGALVFDAGGVKAWLVPRFGKERMDIKEFACLPGWEEALLSLVYEAWSNHLHELDDDAEPDKATPAVGCGKAVFRLLEQSCQELQYEEVTSTVTMVRLVPCQALHQLLAGLLQQMVRQTGWRGRVQLDYEVGEATFAVGPNGQVRQESARQLEPQAQGFAEPVVAQMPGEQPAVRVEIPQLDLAGFLLCGQIPNTWQRALAPFISVLEGMATPGEFTFWLTDGF